MAFPRLGKPPPFRPARRPQVFSGPAAPEPPVSSRVAVSREYPPNKIALRVNSPSGQKARWAEDEHKAENVLSDIEINTEMPGGYKDMSCTLGRNPQLDWPDLEAYGDVYAYMPGGTRVFEGSMDKTPLVSGDSQSITPTMLGYQAILEDNMDCRVGFINSEINAWTGPSPARRAQLAAANPVHNDPEVYAGAAYSSLRLAVEGLWQAPYNPLCEAWFDAGSGIKIAAVYGDWVNGFGDTNFVLYVRFALDEIATGFEGSGDYYGATSGHISQGPASAKRYAFIDWLYASTPAGTNGGLFAIDITNLKVVGTTGIELSGTWPNVGMKPKQMLEYLIPNFAQPLSIDPNEIDDDGFLVSHAWYNEQSSVADVMKDILKYGLLDWFCYHGKRLDYKKPGTYGKYWKAYVAPSELNETGGDSQRLWRSIVVSYQEAGGVTRTVGPIGSGADVETGQLEITDPEHPAVKANRTRKDVLNMGGISTPAGAIQVGQRFLEEANLIDSSGSATLAGYVMDQYGVFWPSAIVKAGDWISFVDAADNSYRKIVNTSYKHNEKSNEIDLDAPASGLEALLERLQAGLISLGVS